MNTRRLDVCLIGAGPRGLAVLERICANAEEVAPGTDVTVHVVDPFPPGAGRVWRTTQPRRLLTNTVASQTTVFTDESVEMAGPLVQGPSLYEWARFLALGLEDEDGPDCPESVLAEARALTPDSYPTRAFCGYYLGWVFQRVRNTAPRQVTVVVHRARAVALRDESPGGSQWARLENGIVLTGLHAVVMAQGHLPLRSTTRERRLTAFADRHGLRYIPPANPADVDLSDIRSDDHVALLGLGLNFFDYMALFTEGRGGTYRRREGRLVYVPSGLEPRLSAGSRRGLPFHARGENQKGPHGRHTPLLLTPEVIKDLRTRSETGRGLDFRTAIWPLVAKEVETVYYTTLLTARGRTEEAERLRAEYPAAPAGSTEESRALAAAGIGPADRWDWERVARPFEGQSFASPRDFQDWLLGYLRADVDAALAGNVDGPLKAALDVLRDVRNEVRLLVDHGGLAGSSHRDDLDGWYTPLNAFLSIGPPARRIEEAVALIEAGVLRVLGPDTTARQDAENGVFVLDSARVPGSRCEANVLVDARLPAVDLRTTADPLLTSLLEQGQCRPHVLTGDDGVHYETGGLAVSPCPFHLLDARGAPHPRRFAYGVPTESVHWATAAGIRPGVNSVTLGDADALARTLLLLGTAPNPSIENAEVVVP
ncbi:MULTISPECIES: FAD/NAD(P)-binding domain-containing protein [unclassified Streptomyces]|uniref:FAD/NAD(P)-binding protein n=1 Tax=unclassified Streptomyces TaxID=2593676 RepID=UPI00190E06B7|nr:MULTISPECIES: FAD/NAD(P)-binding protein [unclassified Streptomyces]MBK3569930.1 FAD/NAD(P)-binding protein [Streptomyces sp. MBT62]MBK6016248.1 FAD/NAD(P)-binding protein [Streptomyces sp. MBT53]